jgi:hypothetical protein
VEQTWQHLERRRQTTTMNLRSDSIAFKGAGKRGPGHSG